MKLSNPLKLTLTATILIALFAGCSCQQCAKCETAAVTKRTGMVVGIKPEAIEEYKRLHADDNAGVRDLLTKYNMSNFSIYMTEIEGKWYEFGYWEYTGTDFDGDMAELSKEQRNTDWLKLCDPMQVPLKGESGWREMELVYRNP